MPNHSLTPCVGSSPASASLSEFTCTYRVKVSEPSDGRESCVELVHAIGLSLPRAHHDITKKIVAHCYPLRAPVEAVDR